eukprot:1396451-Pyramimonas_sp.AAC.1
MTKPTVQDMKDVNSLVRSTRREGKMHMIFRGGFDFEKSVIIASHDASFDNMPNHKSQRGFYIMVGRWCYDGRPQQAIPMHATGL